MTVLPALLVLEYSMATTKDLPAGIPQSIYDPSSCHHLPVLRLRPRWTPKARGTRPRHASTHHMTALGRIDRPLRRWPSLGEVFPPPGMRRPVTQRKPNCSRNPEDWSGLTRYAGFSTSNTSPCTRWRPTILPGARSPRVALWN